MAGGRSSPSVAESVSTRLTPALYIALVLVKECTLSLFAALHEIFEVSFEALDGKEMACYSRIWHAMRDIGHCIMIASILPSTALLSLSVPRDVAQLLKKSAPKKEAYDTRITSFVQEVLTASTQAQKIIEEWQSNIHNESSLHQKMSAFIRYLKVAHNNAQNILLSLRGDDNG